MRYLLLIVPIWVLVCKLDEVDRAVEPKVDLVNAEQSVLVTERGSMVSFIAAVRVSEHQQIVLVAVVSVHARN